MIFSFLFYIYNLKTLTHFLVPKPDIIGKFEPLLKELAVLLNIFIPWKFEKFYLCLLYESHLYIELFTFYICTFNIYRLFDLYFP